MSWAIYPKPVRTGESVVMVPVFTSHELLLFFFFISTQKPPQGAINLFLKSVSESIRDPRGILCRPGRSGSFWERHHPVVLKFTVNQ